MARKSPHDMTNGEINRRLDALDKKDHAITQKMIAAGRGYEKVSESEGKTDALSRQRIALLDEYSDIRAEMRRRYGPDVPYRMPINRRTIIARKSNPASFPNIEKSEFRKGEYVGYDASGNVYRIKRHSVSGWFAVPQNANAGLLAQRADTLKQMSELLAEMNKPQSQRKTNPARKSGLVRVKRRPRDIDVRHHPIDETIDYTDFQLPLSFQVQYQIGNRWHSFAITDTQGFAEIIAREMAKSPAWVADAWRVVKA